MKLHARTAQHAGAGSDAPRFCARPPARRQPGSQRRAAPIRLSMSQRRWPHEHVSTKPRMPLPAIRRQRPKKRFSRRRRRSRRTAASASSRARCTMRTGWSAERGGASADGTPQARPLQREEPLALDLSRLPRHGTLRPRQRAADARAGRGGGGGRCAQTRLNGVTLCHRRARRGQRPWALVSRRCVPVDGGYGVAFDDGDYDVLEPKMGARRVGDAAPPPKAPSWSRRARLPPISGAAARTPLGLGGAVNGAGASRGCRRRRRRRTARRRRRRRTWTSRSCRSVARRGRGGCKRRCAARLEHRKGDAALRAAERSRRGRLTQPRPLEWATARSAEPPPPETETPADERVCVYGARRWAATRATRRRRAKRRRAKRRTRRSCRSASPRSRRRRQRRRRAGRGVIGLGDRDGVRALRAALKWG